MGAVNTLVPGVRETAATAACGATSLRTSDSMRPSRMRTARRAQAAMSFSVRDHDDRLAASFELA